ncbi:monooxygenase [Lecanora helva]
MASTRIRAIHRIAIIGAGPSGVAAAKGILVELGDVEIDIFEQQISFGGVWNYSSNPNGTIDVPQTDPNYLFREPFHRSDKDEVPNACLDGTCEATFASPMYDRLEANTPHFSMKFSDAPSLENNQLFPFREDVKQYLEIYGQDVRHLVHFQTQVIDVRRKGASSQEGWIVQTKDLVHPTLIQEREYHALIIANGHYTVPRLPAIKGIRDWDKTNQGLISHSKSYRRPEPFAHKKTIVVGNSASTIEIAAQISEVCKRPLLNSIRSGPALLHDADYCQIVPEIVEFLASSDGRRAVRFSDGRIERDIEAIVFCTGYFYSVPFLSSLSPEIIATGDRVQHLYQHIWYIPDPTLVFVGLPSKIVPFPTVEGQVAVIARVWSQRLSLPSEDDMRKWEKARITECGDGKAFHVLAPLADLDYHNEMVAWASSANGETGQKLPPPWSEQDRWTRERLPKIRKAFAEKGEERHRVRTIEELGFDYNAWRRENSHG